MSIQATASAIDYGVFVFSSGVAWKNGDPSTGIVVVPSNVSAFTITVPVVDDTIVEATEQLSISVGGVVSTGAIVDNDAVVTPPPFEVGLDPVSDDGPSNTDQVTGVIEPEFSIDAGTYLVAGGTVRLVDVNGQVVGTSSVTAADIAAGRINVQAEQLDDGVYTFTTQILGPDGTVLASAPVTVTIVTDVDGVAPSVELAANGGDHNKDGVLDWQQHTVAQLPLASLADYLAGKDAATSSFGAILAGTPDAANAAGEVDLTEGAQLLNLSLAALTRPLPADFTAASPVFNFSIQAEDAANPLADMDASRAGLQTRVVLDLAPGGVGANDYLKQDASTGAWFSFLDDQRLDTMDDGATLIDSNGDGRVDRVVVTLTDGGTGDSDGVANGTIVDPGILATRAITPPPGPDPTDPVDPPPPPSETPVFEIRLSTGDLYYTTDTDEAIRVATGVDNQFEGVRFTAAEQGEGGIHYAAYY